MRVIDLHGMFHSDAITYVEDIVLEESMKSKLFEVKVITGNSNRLQRRIKKEVCKRHKLNYIIQSNNLGCMIIYNSRLL